MPRIIIQLDEPIKGWDTMSGWEREMEVNKAMEKAVDEVLTKFETIALKEASQEIILSENSIANCIVLDTENDHIITRMK
jgi:hypothetical protein